jgi:hypothetical protein
MQLASFLIALDDTLVSADKASAICRVSIFKSSLPFP